MPQLISFEEEQLRISQLSVMSYLSDISVKENFRILGEGKGIDVLKGKMICPIKLLGNYIYQGITSTNRKRRSYPLSGFGAVCSKLKLTECR